MGNRVAALALAVCLAMSAQIKLNVDQVVSFVTSSIKLGHPDRRIAEYLTKVTLTQKLESSAIDELKIAGAGPRTIEALRALQEKSKALTAPPPKVAPPPPPPRPTIAPPSDEVKRKALREATQYARDYTKQLPNFICMQVTRRYYDPTGREDWRRDSTITAQLSYFEQKEDYKILMVDNRSTTGMAFERVGGATSSGEFGSMMKEIFDPETRADFRWERWGTLHGRRMHVFSYRVAQINSKWSIRHQGPSGGAGETIRPGYGGFIYVDNDTTMIMRITLEAADIPLSFPIQEASLLLDYDFVKISEREFILPLKSAMRMRESRTLIKNETEFRLYRKFGAESQIKAVDMENLPPIADVQEQISAPPDPIDVEQLAAFVKMSLKAKQTDLQIADNLAKVTVTQRLDPPVVEELRTAGAGPKTMEALKALIEATKNLFPPPPKQ